MVFVVDALAGWLVGLLADAGRKKLTAVVLGDAQERALQQAAIVATQDTADELSPSDGQRAGQIVMVINEVFRRRRRMRRWPGRSRWWKGCRRG